MASFVEARRKRQLDDWRFMAQVGYSSGIIGSMSLSKTRPRFADVYNFPKEEEKLESVERKKAEMLAWAANMNRISRRRGK
jgi:hypothetical protein